MVSPSSDVQLPIAQLTALVADGGVLVLSGAGISTESGIPDYRGPTGAARVAQPMTYQRFVASEDARRRYWARSFFGWRQISSAQPNAGHYAVAELERDGLVDALITQNVDGLHTAAGSDRVVELHGNLDRTICLNCRHVAPRSELDERLRAANPVFAAELGTIKPDGDVDIAEQVAGNFVVVDCRICGGVLKPDVVFFGESVPRERVQHCYELVDAAASLLVLGSSLTVFSGLRYVRRAATNGIPIAIVNDGPTRGDDLATVRCSQRLGHVLPRLVSSQRSG